MKNKTFKKNLDKQVADTISDFAFHYRLEIINPFTCENEKIGIEFSNHNYKIYEIENNARKVICLTPYREELEEEFDEEYFKRNK